MEENPYEEFGRLLEQGNATAEAKADQLLADLRAIYQLLTPDQRTALGEWAERIAPLTSGPGRGVQGELHLRVGYNDIHVGGLSAAVIKDAFDHWNRGEEYTPRAEGCQIQ